MKCLNLFAGNNLLPGAQFKVFHSSAYTKLFCVLEDDSHCEVVE